MVGRGGNSGAHGPPRGKDGVNAAHLLGWLVAMCVLSTHAFASAQAADPHLVWRTIRTEHFEVHYHEPLGVLARRAAAVGERALGILTRALDHEPEGRIQVVLSDDADGANGSATAIPYNAIRLFASGPEDISALSDYDDWLSELITHESTHVVHLDTIGGVPALINAVFGKVYSPNSSQPRWFLEGLAVHEESEHTSAGRNRSSVFDMYLRMDVLEDRVLRLDQVSNFVDRFPRGNAWYLYGSRFVSYIGDTYGPEALAAISHVVRATGDPLRAEPRRAARDGQDVRRALRRLGREHRAALPRSGVANTRRRPRRRDRADASRRGRARAAVHRRPTRRLLGRRR